MSERSEYVGRIQNSSTQQVKGPHVSKPGGGNTVIKTGTDLRSGK